mmetsp:Transcript_281/g.999  ORF Transcript_281/g.999 Transcript_281/m.999 type:complete len:209 (+) Transcript_281:3580-4206(+)
MQEHALAHGGALRRAREGFRGGQEQPPGDGRPPHLPRPRHRRPLPRQGREGSHQGHRRAPGIRFHRDRSGKVRQAQLCRVARALLPRVCQRLPRRRGLPLHSPGPARPPPLQPGERHARRPSRHRQLRPAQLHPRPQQGDVPDNHQQGAALLPFLGRRRRGQCPGSSQVPPHRSTSHEALQGVRAGAGAGPSAAGQVGHLRALRGRAE